jgi:cytoskeletal protein RodZ
LLRYAPDMTLRDLAARTRLPQDELAALDRGDTSRCGGDFYLRAHLTCIAAALHVEPDTLLLSFDRRPPARLPDGTLGMRAPVRHRRRASGKRVLWSSVIVLLLGCVAVAGYKVATRTTTTPAAGKQHAAAVVRPPVRHATPHSTSPLPPPVPPGTVAVALSVKGGPTWLLAQDQNGATLFEGTVPDGAVQMLRGASVHTVIGNAGAVTPTCNYHRGAVLGGPGQVVTTTFAPGMAGC